MTTKALKNRFASRPVTVSDTLSAVRTTIGLWRARARQRRQLAEMSPEMLADIGVSRAAARAEAGKPFWSA